MFQFSLASKFSTWRIVQFGWQWNDDACDPQRPLSAMHESLASIGGTNVIVADSEALASSSLQMDRVIGSVLFWTMASGKFKVFAISKASKSPRGNPQKRGAK